MGQVRPLPGSRRHPRHRDRRTDRTDPRERTADLAPDELTEAKARELLEQGKSDGRVLGADPVSGNQIVARDGRYGPYVTEVIEEMTEEQIQAYLDAQPTEYYKNGKPKPKKKPKPVKPRTASLFKSMDLATVTLEQALQLMSLPRVLGTDAEGGNYRAERPLWPVPEEGHGFPLDWQRGRDLHDYAGAGAGDLLPAEAARSCGG